MSERPQLTYAEAANLYEKLEARAAIRRRRSSASATERLRVPGLRIIYGLTAGSAAAVAVAAAVLFSGGGAQQLSPTSSGGTGFFGRSTPSTEGVIPRSAPIGTDPLWRGRSVGLSQAARLLGTPVLTPNAPLANARDLSVIWATRGEVALDYAATQIRVTMKPANAVLRKGALGAFMKMAAQLHMAPGAFTINGAPALADGGGSAKPGFVQIVRDGLNITVTGDRSAAQLISIARSLRTESRSRAGGLRKQHA